VERREERQEERREVERLQGEYVGRSSARRAFDDFDMSGMFEMRIQQEVSSICLYSDILFLILRSAASERRVRPL
jgi:hypothetical protein